VTAAGEPRRLTTADLRADFPAWMPDGREIVFSARGNLWRLSVERGNTPSRISSAGEDGSMPAISRPPPGKPARLVYVRSFVDTNFWRVDTAASGLPITSPPIRVMSSTKSEFHCRLSPDGRRLAFTSHRSGGPEIYLSRPDGSDAVPLTSLGAVDTTWPDWSPDGRLIAFSSTAAGEFDVYTIPAAGGKPRRLTAHPGIDLHPTFSRDGRSIYFSSMRSGDYRIWKMPTEGGDPVQVTPNQGRGAFESPDGKYLYYHAVSTAAPLWRLPLSGGEPVKVVDGVHWFNFFVVDKGIYYIDRTDGGTRLQYLDFTTGRFTTVANNLGDVSAGLTATRDGRTILYTRVDSSADDLMLVENFR
jgi:dipeptidyl aminopeptidase/acylaminoacyl peptidase